MSKLVSASFKAVIFDLDGVIVDSEPLHQRAFLDVFRDLGYEGRHGIRFADYLGRSDRALWVDFIALHKPSQRLEELLPLKQNRLVHLIQAERPLFRDIPQLVRDLSARFPLAVASGSPHAVIDTVLAIEGLRRHFATVSSVQDVAGKGKPAPDVFLHAAKSLNVAPDRCVVIEDSSAGVDAGLAAGMTVIAITNSLGRHELRRAHHVVETYREIRALLLATEGASSMEHETANPR